MIQLLSQEIWDSFSPFKVLTSTSLHEKFQSAATVEQFFNKKHKKLSLFMWLLSAKHVGLLNEELKLLPANSPIKEMIISQLLTIQNGIRLFHQIFCYKRMFPHFIALLEDSPWLLNQLNPKLLIETYSYQTRQNISVFNVILEAQNIHNGVKFNALMNWINQLNFDDYQLISNEYLFTLQNFCNGDYGIQILIKSFLGRNILRRILQEEIRLGKICSEIFHQKLNVRGIDGTLFTQSVKYLDILSPLLKLMPSLYLTLDLSVFNASVLEERLPYFLLTDEGIGTLASLFEKSLNLNNTKLFEQLVCAHGIKNSVQAQTNFVQALCHQTHGYRILKAFSIHLINNWTEDQQPFLKIMCKNAGKMFAFLLVPHENTSLFFKNKNTVYTRLILNMSKGLNKENTVQLITSLFTFILTKANCGQLNGQLLQNQKWGMDFLLLFQQVCMAHVDHFCVSLSRLVDLTPQKIDLLHFLLSIPIPTYNEMTLLGSMFSKMCNIAICGVLLQKMKRNWDKELAFSGIDGKRRNIIEEVVFKHPSGKAIPDYLIPSSILQTTPDLPGLFHNVSEIKRDIEALFTPDLKNGIPPFCNFITQFPQITIPLLRKINDPVLQNLMADYLMMPIAETPQTNPRSLLIYLILNSNNYSFIEVLRQCPWLINQNNIQSLFSFHKLAHGEELHGILPISYLSFYQSDWEHISNCILARKDFFHDFLFHRIGQQPIVGMQMILGEEMLIFAIDKYLLGDEVNKEKILQAFSADDELNVPLVQLFLENGNIKALLSLLNNIPGLSAIIAKTFFSRVLNIFPNSYFFLSPHQKYRLKILLILLNEGYMNNLLTRDELYTPQFASFLNGLSKQKEEHSLLKNFFTNNMEAIPHLMVLLVEQENNDSLLQSLFEQDLIKEFSILEVFKKSKWSDNTQQDLLHKIYCNLEDILRIKEAQMDLLTNAENCDLVLFLFNLIRDHFNAYLLTERRMVRGLLDLALVFIKKCSCDLVKMNASYPLFLPLFTQLCFKYNYQIHLDLLCHSDLKKEHDLIAFILTTPYKFCEKEVTILGQAIEDKKGKKFVMDLFKSLPEEYIFSYKQIFPGVNPFEIKTKIEQVMKHSDAVIKSRFKGDVNQNSTIVANRVAYSIWQQNTTFNPSEKSEDAANKPPL